MITIFDFIKVDWAFEWSDLCQFLFLLLQLGKPWLNCLHFEIEWSLLFNFLESLLIFFLLLHTRESTFLFLFFQLTFSLFLLNLNGLLSVSLPQSDLICLLFCSLLIGLEFVYLLLLIQFLLIMQPFHKCLGISQLFFIILWDFLFAWPNIQMRVRDQFELHCRVLHTWNCQWVRLLVSGRYHWGLELCCLGILNHSFFVILKFLDVLFNFIQLLLHLILP